MKLDTPHPPGNEPVCKASLRADSCVDITVRAMLSGTPVV